MAVQRRGKNITGCQSVSNNKKGEKGGEVSRENLEKDEGRAAFLLLLLRVHLFRDKL